MKVKNIKIYTMYIRKKNPIKHWKKTLRLSAIGG